MVEDCLDRIKDYQEEPWFCTLHNCRAEKTHFSNKDWWGCPKCLSLINDVWDIVAELVTQQEE